MQSLIRYANSIDVEKTRSTVRGSIASFLEFIQGIDRAELTLPGSTRRRKRTGEEFEILDKYSVEYLESDRDKYTDLVDYLMYLRNQGAAPLSIWGYKSSIYNWFIMNDIEVSAKKERILNRRMPKGKILTKDTPIRLEDIRLAMEHMSMPLRPLILCLMSSGMRIGEALGIRDEDIDWNTKPITIRITDEISKTNSERFVLISSEAGKSLTEWYKIREKWVGEAQKKIKSLNLRKENDDRVFPMSQMSMGKTLSASLRRAGMYEVDGKTNRSKITFHSFRKFFSSQMKNVMPPEHVELLMGHVGYLSKSYRRYTEDEIRESYLNAEYVISLNSPIDIKEVMRNKDAVNALASENTRLSTTVEIMIEKYNQLDGKFDRLTDARVAIEKHVEEKGL